MNAERDFDWSSLEDHVRPDGTFAPPTTSGSTVHARNVKFACEHCGGSGKWRGGVNRAGERRCFACGGRGYFLTSENARRQARVKRVASKAKKLAEARAAWDEQNPGLGEFLRSAASWSSFAGELCNKLAQYGALTDGATRAARSMQAKCAERREARAAERQAGNATVDLAPIRAMFETAVTNGYKRPCYRAAGLAITRAPDHGRNPGALYVVEIESDDYLGKIIGTAYTGKPAPALAAIALDPRGEAIRYGQRTGTCSCCGRELTNEGSIEAGIGPICASKWGL